MKYCPECRGEYEDFAEKCADCGLELVDTLPEPEPEPESSIVTVHDTSYTTEPLEVIAECASFIDAQLGREILESEGIKCFVPDNDTNIFNWTGASRDPRQVLVVREPDAARAREILKDIEKDNPEIHFLKPGLAEDDETRETDDEDTHD
jgi:hypothetical protein